jgi:hypothetical protein
MVSDDTTIIEERSRHRGANSGAHAAHHHED